MKTFAAILLTCGLAVQAWADEGQWVTSLPRAVDLAKRENKTILLDFTGSDWCGWCIKLKEDTLSKPEFLEYASKNLILVELDFPRTHPQADDIRSANQALKERFGVSGFPTLIALSPDEKVLWKQTGYAAGGPTGLIAKLGGAKPKPAPTTPVPAPTAAAAPAPVSFGSIGFPKTTPPRQKGGEPKLQGIFFSRYHPSVMLDGTSCAEGETVNGMKVLKIVRDKVTVEWKGATKDLSMN